MNSNNIRPGQRIRFDTHSNLGIREDTVRGEVFMQVVPGYPELDSGSVAPAVLLANHSWCWVSDVVEVLQ